MGHGSGGTIRPAGISAQIVPIVSSGRAEVDAKHPERFLKKALAKTVRFAASIMLEK